MKKVFFIGQLVLMYVLHLVFWIMVGLEESGRNPERATNVMVVISGLLVVVALINIILSVFSVFKDNPNPIKMTLAVKLAAIPWYVVNLGIWMVLALGMLNPFFLVALPIVIVLGIAFTYLVMVSTSLYNVAYLIRGLSKQMFPKRPVFIPALVFHFIFCLDVVGSVLLLRSIKKGY